MKLSRRKRLTGIKRVLRNYHDLGYIDAHAEFAVRKRLLNGIFVMEISCSTPVGVDRFLRPFYNGRNLTITAPRTLRAPVMFEPKTVATGLFPATPAQIDHQNSMYAAGTALQQLDTGAAMHHPDSTIERGQTCRMCDRVIEMETDDDTLNDHRTGLCLLHERDDVSVHRVALNEDGSDFSLVVHQAKMVDDVVAGRPVTSPTLVLGPETVVSVPSGVSFSKDELDGMRRDELRALAKEFQIAGYGSMRKAELVAALKEMPK